MVHALENLAVADGDPVRTEHIATALTAGSFAYDDGATQTFESVVAPHTSSTTNAHMGSGMWTVKAVSARSGRQVTVPATISTGSSRMAASFVTDSPSSTADPFLLGVTGDTMRRRSAASRHSVTRRGPGPVAASASCALQ